MIKVDKYLKETIQEIIDNGSWDKNPRPKWKDGTPAHSKFITQSVFKYNIDKGEFPITTLRTTALRGAYHDIEAIYQKQTNIIEEMHPSIHSWWEDFIIQVRFRALGSMKKESVLGETYGAIIKKYTLVDKLLKGLKENPFGRRHIIDMWQYHDQNRSLRALVPCAFQTLWSVREEEWKIKDKYATYTGGIHDFSKGTYEPLMIRYIDLTLTQRSMDFMMTASINPAQYVMLGMMVCGHLTHETGITHKLGNFVHFIQNCHIYDRHLEQAKELLKREPINQQPSVKLKENKNFYDYTIDDFEFNIPKGVKKLTKPLELAV